MLQSLVERPFVLHTRCVTGFGGGPEKTILNSPRFLRRLGYQSACAYLHPPNDEGIRLLNERAMSAKARLVSVPDRGPFDFGAVKRLTSISRHHKTAIWHGHDYKSNAIGLLARRRWPMKLVTTVHGWVHHTRRTPMYYAVDKYCLKHYDEVICVSEDLRDECLSLGVRPDRCHLVWNGIDTDDFQRNVSISEAKYQLDEPDEGLLVGAVGRLAPEKGFDLLICAVKRLVQSGLDIRLVIAGEGEARCSLEELIQKLQIGDRVRLLGNVADPKQLYQSLDVFVLSSLREGLPNVLLEAMAYEVPVVATRIAGVPALVNDGKNGVLVSSGSVESLVRGIQNLVSNQSERERLGHAGRKTIESQFSFQERMQRVKNIYDRVMDSSPACSRKVGA